MPAFRERLTIILLALLQSLLLYAAWQGSREGWWPFTIPEVPVYWYTLSIGLLLVMMLSLVRLDDARFWQHVGGLLLSLSGLAGWAAWHTATRPPVEPLPILAPYALSICIGLYILTPFLQARLATGRWRAPYSDLAHHAWQNGLTLVLALVFLGLARGVLLLSSRLFLLIEIDVLERLLDSELFVIAMTGTLFGTGIVIARSRQRSTRTILHILVGLFTGLLPVLSLVILVFLGSLLATGIDQLWDASTRSIWQTTSVTLVLSALLFSQVLFLNAVLQDGTRPAPYPLVFRGVIRLAMLALPVIAAMALYALWLRIDEYGWTVPRFWAAVVSAMLALYTLGYALAQLVPHRIWLGHLPRVNVALALLLLAVIVAGNSPLLDPHRLAADSQLERLLALPADEVEEQDLVALRFQTGRYGPDALRQLQSDLRRRDEALADRITRLLDSDSRRQAAGPALVTSPASTPTMIPVDPSGLQPSVPEGEAPLEPEYLQFLRNDPGAVANCADQEADCMVTGVDVDRDGRNERLLCNLGLPGSLSCRLTRQSDEGDWQWLTVIGWPRTEATVEALRAGDVRVVEPRWQSLQLGDGPVFHLYDPERNTPASSPSLRRAPVIDPAP
ncbi:MAG: DUF4153 domain-containing protein [Pseudohongiellaceae bacterium]